MGQKGKFLSQRAGYTNLWNDIWYTYRGYHSIYFQNFLVREILMYLMTVGLTTTSLILSPQKKISNLIHMSFLGASMYYYKFKTDFNSTFWGKEFIRHLRGIFLTKLHVVKLSTHIIISGAGYRWKKKRTKSKRLYKAEQRICLFYSSVLLLENYNVNNYELDL
jgi:hypothetical protein